MIGGANKWTAWVREWAEKNDVTYSCAVSIPECNQEYHAKYGTRPSKKTLERQQARKAVQTGKKQTKAQASLAEMGKTAKAKVAVASAVVEKIKKRRGRPPKVAEPEADFEITPVKRMAPPSTPPPISKAQVEAVKSKMSPPEDSKARKAQANRDRMAKLRAERKAQGVSATGKTKMAKKADNITLEVMEIAEPTQSTKQGFSQKTIDEVKSALLARVALAKEIPQVATASPTLVPTAPAVSADFYDAVPPADLRRIVMAWFSNFTKTKGKFSKQTTEDFFKKSGADMIREFIDTYRNIKAGNPKTTQISWKLADPDFTPDKLLEEVRAKMPPPKQPKVAKVKAVKKALKSADVASFVAPLPEDIRREIQRNLLAPQPKNILQKYLIRVPKLREYKEPDDRSFSGYEGRYWGVYMRLDNEALARDLKLPADVQFPIDLFDTRPTKQQLVPAPFPIKSAEEVLKRVPYGFTYHEEQTMLDKFRVLFPSGVKMYDETPFYEELLRCIFDRHLSVRLQREILLPATSTWDIGDSPWSGYQRDITPYAEQKRKAMVKRLSVFFDNTEEFLSKEKVGTAKKTGKGFSGGAVCEPCLADYDMIIKHLLEHISDPKEPVDGKDFDQAIHFIKRIRKMKGGYFKIGSRSFGKKHGGAYGDDDEGETDHEDNSDDEEDGLEGDEIIEDDENPNFQPVQPWVQPIDPNQAQIDAEADALFGGFIRRMMMRRMRGAGWEEKPASSGNAFLDTITAVGHDLGKAHPASKYVNPFDAGFKFGEKVVAPALMKTKLGNPKTGIFSKKFWTIKKKHH
jgi:hypothetical protein